MNICTVVSPDWSKYLETSLFSLFSTNPAPIEVYILSDEIEQEQLSKFNNICNYFGQGYTYKYINMIEFYQTFMNSNVNVDIRFSKYTLYRLAIPYLINNNRLLYVDSDLLIIKNLVEFYNMEFGDSWIIGCEDTGLRKGYKVSLGFKEDDTYLNAGVLLLNLKEIRESKVADQWLYLAINKHFEAHDQDILFTTISPKFKVVDAKYNCSLSTSLDYKPHEISIMHYAGLKSKENWVKNLPFSEIWYKWEQKYNNIFT